MLRMLAADLLEEAGYQVIEAANADEAISVLQSRSDIRVLFTDVNMPGVMDGAHLARIVRKRWSYIQIIVTSGKMVPADLALPERSQFVQKPYGNSDLVNIFRSLQL